MDKALDQDLEEKIARMELKLAGMRKQMYALPVNSRMREDAGKVIRNYERDLDELKKSYK